MSSVDLHTDKNSFESFNDMEVFSATLSMEIKALARAQKNISSQALQAFRALFKGLEDQAGQLIFCGVGKSGLVGQKLAATFSSMGLSSFFLHPTEALHGDLGRVRASDALIFLSNSGTTEEIVKLLPHLDHLKEKQLGALLGNPDPKGPIAKAVGGALLDCSVEREACLNNQAPTCSTTVQMAMGDALAVFYQNIAAQSLEQFALNHPAGALGKRLRLKVADLMQPLEASAVVHLDDGKPSPSPSPTSGPASVQETILAMTKYPLGVCLVLEKQKLVGLVTEGDVRRFLIKKESSKVLSSSVGEMMTPIEKAQVVTGSELAIKALDMMEKREHPISVLPVVCEKSGRPLGVLRLHDLVSAGI